MGRAPAEPPSPRRRAPFKPCPVLNTLPSTPQPTTNQPTNSPTNSPLLAPQGEPTVPSLLGDELDTNPFLRPADAGVRAAVGAAPGAADWEVFGAVRAAKDGFRG
jgi:hypothetical protein